MKTIDKIYINGQFVTPQGTDTFKLYNPATNEQTGTVVLGNEEDTRAAIAFAKAAWPGFSRSTKAQRITWLQQMHEALAKRREQLIDAMVNEYGGTLQFTRASINMAINNPREMINTLQHFEFERTVGQSRVRLESVGVAGIITPWNSNAGFITSKLSAAVAAGVTSVIKPSEMSAQQTQIVMEALHEAGLPAGAFNIVNGLGPVVGAELTRHPDIAKISFTGSTVIGKTIARDATATLKRVTLELGGKSPNILLDDADLEKAIPLAIAAAYNNSGQACIAATRLLVPEKHLEAVKALVKTTVENIKVGDPAKEETAVGPMVSLKQYERVQQYIRLGLEEGAELLVGGIGHPEGLEAGNFVKPTVFVQVNNKMRIAREEIFGPVLSILTYKDDAEAVAIANDTDYGLAAYVSSADEQRALHIAAQLHAGRVMVNGFKHDPQAPFGGFKQSGLGREFGAYGLEAYLEPKTILI
ncbi:aldehyde dehydrogenase family protein [Chitinophaga horti]|uniref:aldehyde dehydrogenase (NAD(+)) n=1 Tax=Chitinophaga horti TaxID=2920382 RepID=A0ABY6J225_9BACT|nr:aldehyde dehydrogenase family protein [Chitinophaga horti]UYQ93628.1 aldehyde dehydrogenase family protein [Chitinophaga horti]